MCCAEFIAKYALFISNLLFSLLGLAVIGLGISVLVSLKDLQEILPVNIIPISLIILGILVFFIGFLACCGAIRESRCMLICYAIIVSILIAILMYLTVLIFSKLSTIEDQVNEWIVTAFNNDNIRPVFNVMEATFRCCGTTGPDSYETVNQTLSTTCCPNPGGEINSCTAADAFRGCGDMVGGWFETFSGAIAAVLLTVVIVQVVAVVFALFLSHSISNKRRRNVY